LAFVQPCEEGRKALYGVMKNALIFLIDIYNQWISVIYCLAMLFFSAKLIMK